MVQEKQLMVTADVPRLLVALSVRICLLLDVMEKVTGLISNVLVGLWIEAAESIWIATTENDVA